MKTIDILNHLKEQHKPIKYLFAMNKKPSVVMITGGNGFLASYLIQNLLKRKDVDTIYALVRNKKDLKDNEKLKYIEYSGGNSFLNNDLDCLLEQVDSFIHCAAEVNNIKKINAMYESNVAFTHNILKKITDLKINCAFHYISTLSVFASSNLYMNEYLKNSDDRLINLPPNNVEINNTYEIFGGYAQTKWLSEYILSKTNANIFRLGLVTPDTEKPVFNENEFLTMILNKIITEPIVPFNNKEQLYKNTQKTRVDISPVNYVSKFITEIISSRYFINKDNCNITNIANHMPVSLWQLYNRLESVFGENYIQYLGEEKYVERTLNWKKIERRIFENAFDRKKIVYNGEINFNCDLFQTSLFDWDCQNKSGYMPLSVDIIGNYLEFLRNKNE